MAKSTTNKRAERQARLEAAKVALREQYHVTRDREGVEWAWVTCSNCGGSGLYPSSLIPAGQCRFYCWRDRTPATHGKVPVLLEKLAKADAFAEERSAARAKAAARRVAARAEREAERLAAAAPAAEQFLAAHDGLSEALAGDHPILVDLAARLRRWGSLSEAQVALARRLAAQVAEPELPEVLPPAGRAQVVGTVVKVKEQENRFAYGRLQYKLLVEVRSEAGKYRLFGSLPADIPVDVQRGARVAFTATVEPKEPGFGFYSRPAGAALGEAS